MKQKVKRVPAERNDSRGRKPALRLVPGARVLSLQCPFRRTLQQNAEETKVTQVAED